MEQKRDWLRDCALVCIGVSALIGSITYYMTSLYYETGRYDMSVSKLSNNTDSFRDSYTVFVIDTVTGDVSKFYTPYTPPPKLTTATYLRESNYEYPPEVKKIRDGL